MKHLKKIAQRVRALEKRTIANIVEIGRLLTEAKEQTEHGEFQDWLKSEFNWSYRTSVRYRAAYAISQKCHGGTFAKLNLSVGAVYALADLGDDEADILADIVATISASAERWTANKTYNAMSLARDAKRQQAVRDIAPVYYDDDDDDYDDDSVRPATSEELRSLRLAPDERIPPANELTMILNTLMRFDEGDEGWARAIEEIGAEHFGKIVDMLNAVRRNMQSEIIRRKADRAVSARH